MGALEQLTRELVAVTRGCIWPSATAAALGVDTITLNAEFEPLYESLGFRSLGRGQTWWRHEL